MKSRETAPSSASASGRPHSLTVLVVLAAIVFLQAALAQVPEQMEKSVDADLIALKSPDPQVRVAALRDLQVSLDPRIPDAMLPLLGDKGESIRRLAARAVGSRWWQISKESNPRFIAALESMRKVEDKSNDDVINMATRALGVAAAGAAAAAAN